MNMILKASLESEMLILPYFEAIFRTGSYIVTPISHQGKFLGMQLTRTTNKLRINVFQSTSKAVTDFILSKCNNRSEHYVIIASYENKPYLSANCEVLPFFSSYNPYTEISQVYKQVVASNTPQRNTVPVKPVSRMETIPRQAQSSRRSAFKERETSDTSSRHSTERQTTLLNYLSSHMTITVSEIATLLECSPGVADRVAEDMVLRGELILMFDNPKSRRKCYTVDNVACSRNMRDRLKTVFSDELVEFVANTFVRYADIDDITLKYLDAILNHGCLSAREAVDCGYDINLRKEPKAFNDILNILGVRTVVNHLLKHNVKSRSLDLYKKLRTNYAIISDVIVYMQEEAITCRAYLLNLVENELLNYKSIGSITYVGNSKTGMPSLDYVNPLPIDFDIVDRIGDNVVRALVVEPTLLAKAIEEGRLVTFANGTSVMVCKAENENKYREQYGLPLKEEEVVEEFEVVDRSDVDEVLENVMKQDIEASTSTEAVVVTEEVIESANTLTEDEALVINSLQEGNKTLDELIASTKLSKRKLKTVISKLSKQLLITINTSEVQNKSTRKNAKKTFVETYTIHN